MPLPRARVVDCFVLREMSEEERVGRQSDSISLCSVISTSSLVPGEISSGFPLRPLERASRYGRYSVRVARRVDRWASRWGPLGRRL